MGELKLQCPVTQQRVTRLDKSIAVQAGFPSLQAYKQANNIHYLTVEQRSFQKFKELYNIDFTRWVVGYETDGGMIYATKKYKGEGKAAVPFPLSATQFYEHFKGTSPLAIFAYGNKSSFFTMDIDTKERASQDVRWIVDALLTAGIEREHIHVSFSGSKGYHVTLFSDKPLPITEWHKIGDYARRYGGYNEHDVEYRPNATNGHAVKLPLTLHPKTKAFAGYCDADFNIMSEQASHDYLNEITAISATTIEGVIASLPIKLAEMTPQKVEQEKTDDAMQVIEERLFQTAEEKTDSAIRILTDGLSASGTRWKAMRNTLIPYIKTEMGCDEEETRAILYEFCEREYKEGRSSTPIAESKREVDALIEDFYPLVTGMYSVKKDIIISRQEVDWVVSVVQNGGNRASRDLLWALLLMRKRYEGSAKDGSFYAGRRDLQKLLSKPRTISPSTIQKSRDWLAENGYITFHIPQDTFYKRQATTYTVEYDAPESVEVLGQVTFDQEGDARGLLTQIAAMLYRKPDIRRLKL